MEQPILRVDDVGSNTDMKELSEMLRAYRLRVPNGKIWLAVSMLSKANTIGSVYPDPPFKHKEKEYFYNVNSMIRDFDLDGEIVSHGLVHADHSKLQYDAQEMSIVTSCNFLGTKIFVPPFNRYNEATEGVCRINKIDLVKVQDGWKSLDYNEFNMNHKKWYFHPWKYAASTFKKVIGVEETAWSG